MNALRQIPSGGGTTGSEVSLTVQTPTGQELSACAHGFIGAVRALLDARMRKAHFEASIVWRLEDVPEQHRDVLETQRRRVLDREARLRKNAS